MSAMASQAVIPTGRPFTVADLQGMPDDGNRYELIDAMLIVSPGPIWEHQEMSAAVFVQLRTICPRPLRVIMAPFAVQTADDSEVQPDVLVTRFTDLRSTHLPVAPLLVMWPRTGCSTRPRPARSPSSSCATAGTSRWPTRSATSRTSRSSRSR